MATTIPIAKDVAISYDSAYYSEDDEYRETPYCYDCYDRYERDSYLHSYSYKPLPIFHGEGNRYFGVELEIDGEAKMVATQRLYTT